MEFMSVFSSVAQHQSLTRSINTMLSESRCALIKTRSSIERTIVSKNFFLLGVSDTVTLTHSDTDTQ
jgi:hypothetical protein